ncbi:hypothetical protein PGTUg99_012788 [Puccinia graminis f. sp. tritici]|uniref:Uncharacterized protein n=1 Tax=Puccinia graminis f. sp. tritici TaxID=56615 RepID=A0A5B0SFN4_PUCGR|nr:hypothetical protein PGTUg99_028799 [Puccinia graminis f. sp. tritici]KAA1136249.1 hypothetical protein PGTUg99_012788 [Puccinia graminis f. sp. tritici]
MNTNHRHPFRSSSSESCSRALSLDLHSTIQGYNYNGDQGSSSGGGQTSLWLPRGKPSFRGSASPGL